VDIIIAGPGRAGTALGIGLAKAGHRLVGVLSRSGHQLDAPNLDWDDQLPAADLVVIAVRDDAIAEVAERLAHHSDDVAAAVHVSGLKSIAALDAFTCPVGSFHPLQTLPSGEAGAARLAGAWVAVTTNDAGLRAGLHRLAESLGMRPFDLDDHLKPLYHAGAAAAANYSLGSLGMAFDLFAAAGVAFEAAEPLVRAIVDNAFELGPWMALTGPIARGDIDTVKAQVAAVAADVPEHLQAFKEMGLALARMTGRDEIAEVLT
jgi:predicted short-subunit dehydrogenase-like oxidoreductase (DUF2520 family)